MTDSKVKRQALNVIASVKCSHCGEVHDADSDRYVVFYGDVTIGTAEQVIGGNIDDKGKLASSTIYCRKEECLGKPFGMILGGEISVTRVRSK